MRTLTLMLLMACGEPPGPATPPPGGGPAPNPEVGHVPEGVRVPDAADATMSPAQPGLLTEAEFQALHGLTGNKPPPPQGSTVTLSDGTSAYLSLPASGEPGVPGVVLVHEWWGLNDHIRYWADRLASDGYAALAVDLYEGKVATTSEEAMATMKTVDPEAAMGTLRAARAFLLADHRVKATKIASIGWCFGGGWSLRLAMSEPDLDAAVVYYGRLPEDLSALDPMKAPLLAVFATRDEGIPNASVDAFEAALSKKGKQATILRYDAEHAFANPSGARYDAVAAADAWDKVQAFLAAHLRG